MHISDTEETTRIPEITSEELQDAIRKLKKGKSPDSDGIRAEDIKACDEETKEMVRQIFNEWGARSSCDCDTNEQCPHKGRRLERAFSHAMGEMKDFGADFEEDLGLWQTSRGCVRASFAYPLR